MRFVQEEIPMKRGWLKLGWLALVVLLASVLRPARAATAFSYKGSLVVGGAVVTGTYDFQFTLYTAASGGSVVGTTLSRPGVSVSSGVYTVSLDFGANSFASPPLF